MEAAGDVPVGRRPAPCRDVPVPLEAPAPRPQGHRWYTLALLTLVYALNQGDRFVMSSLLEPIKRDLHLSDASVGFLSGVALALFYVAAGLQIAALADRSNRRNIVAASLALWSILTTLCGICETYLQLLLVRVGVGVGEAGGTAPSHALLSDLFPARQRTWMLALFGIGVSLGTAFASWGAWLSERIGWRPVFFVFGIPGILLALIIRSTVSEPERGALDSPDTIATSGLFQTLRYVRSEPSLRHQMAASFCYVLASWGLIWWLPAYFVRSYGMTVGQAGMQLGWMHGIGGTIGILASVILLRWFDDRDLRWPAHAAAAMTVVSTVAALIALCTFGATVGKAMLWISVTVIYGMYGPTFALMQNSSPPSMRAQMSAIGLLVINLANLVVAPLAVGWTSDLLAPYYGAESLRIALIPLTLLGFVGTYYFWACSRDLKGAMRRAASYNPCNT